MATKDFSKMSSKKLNALMATASEDDQVAIQAILDTRAQVKDAGEDDGIKETTRQIGASTVIETEGSELSPEEAAAVALAEAEYAKEGVKKPARQNSKKTDEERDELKAQADAMIGHKCEVLPYGEVEFVEGVVVGTVVDKRSNNVMHAIKLLDGKRLVKAIGHKTIRISEETVELPAKGARGAKASTEPKRTNEEAAQLAIDSKVNIGRAVMCLPFKAAEGTEKVKGFIVGVTHDKRSNAVMYRISIEGAKDLNKVVNSTDIEMLDEWNEKTIARRKKLEEAKAAEALITPQERYNAAVVALEKAKETFEKAKAALEAREKDVATANALLLEANTEEAPVEDATTDELM